MLQCTHSKLLSDLALSICLDRNLSIHAEHIPGIHNLLADTESRKKSLFTIYRGCHRVPQSLKLNFNTQQSIRVVQPCQQPYLQQKEFQLASTHQQYVYCKGCLIHGPPMPKCDCTWDVGMVIRRSLAYSSELSLKDLSRKLTMLLALVTASRSSELHQLDLIRMQYPLQFQV